MNISARLLMEEYLVSCAALYLHNHRCFAQEKENASKKFHTKFRRIIFTYCVTFSSKFSQKVNAISPFFSLLFTEAWPFVTNITIMLYSYITRIFWLHSTVENTKQFITLSAELLIFRKGTHLNCQQYSDKKVAPLNEVKCKMMYQVKIFQLWMKYFNAMTTVTQDVQNNFLKQYLKKKM